MLTKYIIQQLIVFTIIITNRWVLYFLCYFVIIFIFFCPLFTAFIINSIHRTIKKYNFYNNHFLGINVLLAYSLICSKSPVLKIFVPHLSRFSEKILGEINPLSIAYSISRENSVQKKSSCALAFNKNFSS